MPWRQEAMKGVVHCDKPREVVCRRYTRGYPNGETRLSNTQALLVEHIDELETTRGTETS